MTRDDPALSRRSFLGGVAGLAATAPAATAATAATGTAAGADSDYPIGFPLEPHWTRTFEYDDVSVNAANPETVDVVTARRGDYGEATIHRIEKATGETRWEADFDFTISGVAATDALVFFAGDGSVQAYDPDADDVVWTRSGDYAYMSAPNLADGVLYAVSYEFSREDYGSERYVADESTLYALDPATGDVRWTYESGYLSTPTLVDGTLYAVDRVAAIEDGEYSVSSGDVIALDPASGDLAWRNDSVTSDRVHPYRDPLYAIDRGDAVVGIDPATGRTKWSQRGYGSIEDITSSEDRYFVANADGRVFAVNAADRSVAWTATCPDAYDLTHSEGVLYVGRTSGTFQAFDASTGEELWSHSSPGSGGGYERVRDGAVYLVTDGRVEVFRGQRKLAEVAIENAESGGLTAPVADLLGRDDLLSRARVALESGDYATAKSLAAAAERRESTVNTVLGGTSLLGLYGAGRLGTQYRQRARLTDARDAVAAAYPVGEGALADLEPSGALAAANDRIAAHDSRLGAGVNRNVRETADDELVSRLSALADAAPAVEEASAVLAADRFEGRGDALESHVRTVVETGDAEDLRSLARVLENGLPYVERSLAVLDDLDEEYGETFDAGALLAVADRVVRNPDGRRDEYGPFLAALLGTGETLTEHAHAFDPYDVSRIFAEANDCLANHADVSASLVTRAENLEDVTNAVRRIETALADVDFTYVEATPAEIRDRASALLPDLRLGDLAALTEQVEHMGAGVWTRADLDSFTAAEFEELVARLYAHEDYETTVTQRGEDGGVDVLAETDGERVAVRATRPATGERVGAPAVRETVGAQSLFDADRSAVVTSASFTRDARRAEAEYDGVVELVDGDALLERLTDSPLSPPLD